MSPAPTMLKQAQKVQDMPGWEMQEAGSVPAHLLPVPAPAVGTLGTLGRAGAQRPRSHRC